MLSQETPETPAICQLAVPVGEAPPVGPVTVAENVKEPPSEAIGVLVVTTIEGLKRETAITEEYVGPAVV